MENSISLKPTESEEIEGQEFTIMFPNERVYSIRTEERTVGYLSFNPYKDGFLISNILIFWEEQGKGYGRKTVEMLRKKHNEDWGIYLEEITEEPFATETEYNYQESLY